MPSGGASPGAAIDGRGLLRLALSMRRDLVRLYEGDATAAAEAVADLCREPDVLCGWATRMIRAEDGHAQDAPFTWDEIPAPMMPAAVRGMAEAYLLQTSNAEDLRKEAG